MTISVALCTYNGSQYLHQQLESLLHQRRPPDELVVCDDQSEDGTAEIVSEFATRASFPVRLQRNEQNLGSTKNFEKAIRLCQGDLIALADQDDIWLPKKIACAVEAFASRPALLGFFTDAHLTDSALNPLGYRLWEASGFDLTRQKRFREGKRVSILLQRQVITGATFVFRSCCRDLLLPIPGYAVHDSWLAFLLACVGEVDFTDEPSILYRQHAENQIGARKRSLLDLILNSDVARSRQQLENGLQFCIDARQRLLTSDLLAEGDSRMHAIDAKIQHVRSRLTLPSARWRRVVPILREMISGRYAAFSMGPFSAVQDVVACSVSPVYSDKRI